LDLIIQFPSTSIGYSLILFLIFPIKKSKVTRLIFSSWHKFKKQNNLFNELINNYLLLSEYSLKLMSPQVSQQKGEKKSVCILSWRVLCFGNFELINFVKVNLYLLLFLNFLARLKVTGQHCSIIFSLNRNTAFLCVFKKPMNDLPNGYFTT
jgi:hypothetical protein